MANENVEAISEQQIIAQTILQQISEQDRFALRAWGVSERVALDATDERRGGVMFRVRGSKLRGKIVVELTHLDVYYISSYRFRNGEAHLINEAHDVYCEQLMGAINGMVERNG